MAQRRYRDILAEADEFFAGVLREQPRNLSCGKGCSLCCYGLFEIGDGDLATVAEGLASLHPARRRAVIRKAVEILARSDAPNLRDCTAEEREAFFDRTESVPCPALGEDGLCVMYEHRPLVCRTFGLPLRDGAQYIGDICELNFTSASQEEKDSAAWDLQNEDVAGRNEEYTIPEAIVMAARARGWL